jgi:hypothetical protein
VNHAVEKSCAEIMHHRAQSVDVGELATALHSFERSYGTGGSILPKLYCMVTKAAAAALVAMHKSSLSSQRLNAREHAENLLRHALLYLPTPLHPLRPLCHVTLSYAALAARAVCTVISAPRANPCDLPSDLAAFNSAFSLVQSSAMAPNSQRATSVGGAELKEITATLRSVLSKIAASFKNEGVTITQLGALLDDQKWQSFVRCVKRPNVALLPEAHMRGSIIVFA